jgi:hypothetical protein
MSELGGSESFAPGEDGGGVSEAAREQAAQRFAASQQAAQQQQKDEKKAKKRDDGVAQVILQFLTDTQKTHLATLIARLVARDCPSPFILAVLSLINDKCGETVEEYLKERAIDLGASEIDRSIIPSETALTVEANERMARWLMRMDVTLNVDPNSVLNALIVDDQNIDGTILQLTSFVLQTFLEEQGKKPEFEQLQKLAAGVLQSIFTPHMHARMERRLEDEDKDGDE